ncbi:ABC-type transport auxiliary lipoprotein family protein [Sphingobium sp. AN641]|uniref:ABC-type transport auxiliary lipoprotein family protein n=1 Tax=Sphingobium sp. AN641 TaxID=3133443 RepID=UPI0030C1AB09
MAHRMKAVALAAPLAMLVALPGCISLGAKPPAQLLSLSAAKTVAPGTIRRSGQGASITVADPEAPKTLDTVRVPVRMTPTTLAYVKGAHWADTPRHLFRTLLAETIAANGTRIVLDPGQYSADPGQRLMGELIDFGVDAQSRMAIVTFDAVLTGEGGAVLAKQRFSASSPVSAIDADSIGAPLNQAANIVAADVAKWVAGS